MTTTGPATSNPFTPAPRLARVDAEQPADLGGGRLVTEDRKASPAFGDLSTFRVLRAQPLGLVDLKVPALPLS